MSLNKQSKEIGHINVMNAHQKLNRIQDKIVKQSINIEKEQIARRRIEDLLEEKRLRQQIEDDFPEVDQE